MRESRIRQIDPILALLAILAAGLSLYNINQSGDLNSYYAAAITSMVQSWHNFFFNAYDPGGFITIDKPPVAFWLQAISAKIFGIHSWSLALPSALGLTGSVILLYLMIKPHFGLAAARISALILALTPIAVAVSRTNNADSTLVFFLMLAAYILLKSVRSGKLLTLCIAFGLVGVGFNTKMLQAFMVLPAFYLLYWLARKGQWKQKVLHLLTASVLMGMISLSWAVIVDLTPASERPYVGSSGTSNSVIELALGYNGISRLTGDSGSGGGSGGGNMPSGAPGGRSSSSDTSAVTSESGSSTTAKASTDTSNATATTTSDQTTITTTSSDTSSTSASTTSGNAPPQGGFGGGGNDGGGRSGGGGMSGSGGGGSNDAGDAGILRLFSTENAGQIAWFLPLALLSALMLWLQRREQRHTILFWAAWLAPMIIFFSIAGHIHRYYFIMMAPAIAALTGAGIAHLWQNIHKRWLAIFMAVGIATGLYITISLDQVVLGIITAIIGVIALVIALRNNQMMKKISLTLALVALLAAPVYWSMTPAIYGGNSVQPAAGPELATSSGRSNSTTIDAGLITYLQQNNTGEKYLVATTSSQTATPIILATGSPVIAWGGFKGSDTALTTTQLEAMVTNGELKYVILGGGMGSGSSDLTTWVQEHGTEISESEWSSTSTDSTTSTDTDTQGSQRGGGGGGPSSQLTLYELNK